MSQESLSALMDGECSEAELDAILADFESSAATRQAWSRMCLVRDVLGGARITEAGSDFCGGVMAAIAADQEADRVAEAEAVVVTAPPAPVRPSTVVQLPVVPRRPSRGRWQQPLVGFAAAASIAGAVVLGGNSLLSQRPLAASAASTAAAAAPSGLTPVASRGVTDLAAANDTAETGIDQLDSESARQLNDYVMEHSNYRAEQGMGGSLSYARMAVHNADYRPATGSR